MRLRSLPALGIACAAGAVLLLVCTYLQWHVNHTCVTPLVCLVDPADAAKEPPPCKDITCGFTIWAFAAPAATLAAVSALALAVWATRRRTG